ncbi:MAG TPA: hypothetical protein VI455_02985 [Terriglobia bacterium]
MALRPSRRMVFTVLATATLAVCQEPPATTLDQSTPEEAARLTPKWLSDGDPRHQAWAAHWILRYDQAQQLPALLGIVDRYTAHYGAAGFDSWLDHDSALLAVLDTLIQMQAEVPVEQAAELYSKVHVQALVLLALWPEDRREALLKILDHTPSDMDWLAAADLLAPNAPDGFAARLLDGLGIHAILQVTDPGVGMGMGGGCAGDASGGLGNARLDWPPVGEYHLSMQESPESTIFAGGENPVYVTRTVNRNYTPGSAKPDRAGLCTTRDQLRRDLIAQLLGVKKDDFELQLYPQSTIGWNGDTEFLQAAAAFVEQQQLLLQNVSGRLHAFGLLTAAEADVCRPQLSVEVVDLRSEKTPLPELILSDPTIAVSYK